MIELLKEKNALNDKPVHRVVFHEITKNAILEAIKNPRGISCATRGFAPARQTIPAELFSTTAETD